MRTRTGTRRERHQLRTREKIRHKSLGTWEKRAQDEHVPGTEYVASDYLRQGGLRSGRSLGTPARVDEGTRN